MSARATRRSGSLQDRSAGSVTMTDRVEADPHVPLASYTTLGIGGAARWFTTARTVHDAVQAYRSALDHGHPVFVLGGGSNIVVADSGFDGLVLRVGFTGCALRVDNDELHLDAGAAEPWD